MDATKNKGGRPRKETVVKTKQGRAGLYEYKATVGHDELEKPIRKSFYSKKSLKEAKEKALKYIEEQAVKKATGESVKDSKVKFRTIALEWLEVYKKGHVKDNTYRGRNNCAGIDGRSNRNSKVQLCTKLFAQVKPDSG